MEDPAKLCKQSMPFRSPLSRYYHSATGACVDAVAFTSACTIDISAQKSSPDENRKPAQSSSSCSNIPDHAACTVLRDCEQRSRHGHVRSRKDDTPQKPSGKTPSPKQLSTISHQQLALHYQPPSPCSICGKSLQIGFPSRCLAYSELKQATEGFSRNNFLSEGESAYVYRGVLSDGRQVAVKSVGQTSGKFLSEIQILGSVQHPNVISLVGYCSEAARALLVYDFICNGTLDWHLSARNPNVVPWSARRVIAVQVARGLQFLHECQLGCLVHRDIRAQNILLTHDYTPVIAGFGLAKWTELGEEDELVQDSVQDTSPGSTPVAEFSFQTERPTEKTDVYAFGVLLLELISGRTVMDVSHYPQDQRSLVEWARPLLVEDFEDVIHRLLDPRLGMHYKHYELFCMVNAASMCIRKDPATRPRMKQMLSCLEDARERSKMSSKSNTPLMEFVQVNQSSSPSSSSTAADQGGGTTCTNQSQLDFRNSSAKSKKKDRRKAALTVTWQLPDSYQMVSSKQSCTPACSNKPVRLRPKLLSYSELL